MSAPAFAWAIEQGREHGLTPPERLVLIYLADKANGSRVCWPGQDLISEYTGLTSRTIRDCTARLADVGLIKLGWRGKVRLYYIQRAANGEDYNPEHRKQFPMNRSTTPEAASDERHPVTAIPEAASDERVPVTGNPRTPHRKLAPKTPEAVSDYPVLKPDLEPKKASKVQDSEEKKQEESIPSPAVDTAPLVTAIARGMFSNYPPRAAVRSPNEQRDAFEPPKPPIRAYHLAGAHLAAERAAAMARLRPPP